MDSRPSVTALQRWLYVAAILRFFSGKRLGKYRPSFSCLAAARMGHIPASITTQRVSSRKRLLSWGISLCAVYLGFFDYTKFQTKLFNKQPQAGAHLLTGFLTCKRVIGLVNASSLQWSSYEAGTANTLFNLEYSLSLLSHIVELDKQSQAILISAFFVANDISSFGLWAMSRMWFHIMMEIIKLRGHRLAISYKAF